jgi:hypothetical protein
MVEPDTGEERFILLGASNLGCCATRLRRMGKNVVDLTAHGWVASPEYIAALL